MMANREKGHMMELPRRISIGYDILKELGSFLQDFGFEDSVLVVSGPNVRRHFAEILEDSLITSRFKIKWYRVESSTKENALKVAKIASDSRISVVVGLGGGKSVDISKLGAFHAGKQFVSVPTSASHDGIASPFASMKGLDKPYSLVSRPPIGIIADINVIAGAPRKLLASGCGDLISKITAVKDWELSRDVTGEYFGKYAASLASMSAEILVNESIRIDGENKDGVRDIVEALISTGVAAGIAGSSRPCSGSEHMISHALDLIAPGKGLHGEKCGMATILMAKLHGLDWEIISRSLTRARCPIRAADLGLSSDEIAKAIVMAPTIRKDRYTILTKERLSHDDALRLVKETNVA